jgi:hypothetical protein
MKTSLHHYIEDKNLVRWVFQLPPMDADNLSLADVIGLLDLIEDDLSPENLTCDGELRGPALRKKQDMLMGAWHILGTLKTRLEQPEATAPERIGIDL